MNPIIGQLYAVPCVKHLDTGYWTPVLGPKHSDAEIIGFKPEHYHLDFRFINDRAWQLLGLYEGPEGMGKVAYTNDHAVRSRLDWDIDKVKSCRRRCVRLMPEFPTHFRYALPFVQKLETAYEKIKMKCMVCPHRRLPLDGLPVVDGKVVCPGHGLQWNVATGELVRRTKP